MNDETPDIARVIAEFNERVMKPWVEQAARSFAMLGQQAELLASKLEPLRQIADELRQWEGEAIDALEDDFYRGRH